MRALRMAAAFVLMAMLVTVPRAGAANTTTYTSAQLDQMVSPIALYPDSLLSQIMMAATYPIEIVDAQRWVAANPNVSGSALQQQLATKNWDPSVISLVSFPDVLNRMSQNLDWTEALGEAFLGQQKEVLEAVQRMRAKAQAAGTLQTTSQQTVTTSQNEIIVAPASTETVYVPLYDPATAYGSSWSYPSWYWPGMMAPPVGYVAGSALMWGTGVAVGAAMFGGVNWYNHGVYVNHNYWNYPAYRTGAANSVYARNGNAVVRNGNTYVNNVNVNRYNQANVNNVNRTNVNRTNVNNSLNKTNLNWQYDNNHRQGTNFQNQNLQNRYNPSTAAGNRGYNRTSETMPGSRSIPYTPPANTSFGQYGNANNVNRDATRGAGSTGRSGANWGNVQRSAPTRQVGGWDRGGGSFNRGSYGGGSFNRGGYGGGGRGGFRGGGRR